MKVKYVDCLIIFQLLNHIKLTDGVNTLSDEIQIKIKTQQYLFLKYSYDFELFKINLNKETFDKYNYKDILNKYDNNEIEDVILKKVDFDLLNSFTENRVNKLCSLVEIPDIKYFTYDEFYEIVKLNINNGDFYVPYIFFEALSADTFIHLLATYLTNF